MMIILALLAVGSAQAVEIKPGRTISGAFLSNSLSISNALNNQLRIRQKTDDLRGDIYEFDTKSPLKAFAYSLIIPGAGQFYNESKIKAGSFFAVDIALISGYLIYNSKGKNQEDDYRAYADEHYLASVFRTWWDAKDSSYQNKFSHRLYFDNEGNPLRTHEYYENIGKYDQFQVGWDDIGINIEPPAPGQSGGTAYISPNRRTYLDMRKKANDYFAKATTLGMIAMGNHLVSAFEAAIGAKKYNRGTKQYSLDMQTRNIDGNVAPFFVVTALF
jgi:hypothetical protein